MLEEFLQKQYGIRTDVIENVITVGTTPVRLAQNNPNRISYTLSNLSTNSIFTSHSPNTTITTGAVIGALNGQGFDWRADGETVGYDLYGVAAAGSNLVYVREVVIIDPIKQA